MAHITEEDAQAWLEETKLEIGSLDAAMESQIASEVLGRISTAGYDVSGWTDSATTPALVKKVISMYYGGWFYDKVYSETDDTNSYATRLKRAAATLLRGIVEGSIDLVEVEGPPAQGAPVFFPTDASSALRPNEYDIGDGPAAFGMGARF